MVRCTATDRAGREVEWWEYDPEFEPELPAGALRGDPSKQIFCTTHHVPKYFYVDEWRDCVQCGSRFRFTADDQRYWYETLKFNFNSVAIRCRRCRKLRRSEAALRNQVAVVRQRLQEDPNDPSALLGLAEALVRYHQRTGQGRLADAIASARRARSLWPAAVDGLFWEGIAQHLDGRPDEGGELLRTFLRAPAIRQRRFRPLASEACAIVGHAKKSAP